MPRLLTVASLAFLMLTAAACGGSGGGGDDADGDSTPAPTSSATPAAPAAGFVTVKGADWSFTRPESWTKAGEPETEKGKESEIFQSAPGTQGIPSQIGIGTASQYKNSLQRAVRIAKDIDETRFPTLKITKEGPLEIEGGEGFKIDATYDSFTDQPIPIRIVNVYVQTPDKRQMNFFVRGPETDLQDLGLDQLVDSFRVLPGRS